MKISIENIRLASSNEWDEIWRECEYSTYFHSREWSEIWFSYTKGKMRPNPKLILFSDGKKALLPFSKQKDCKGLITTYVTSPAGTYGGWISKDELNIEHAILLTNFLTKKFDNIVWRQNPYDNLLYRVGIKPGKYDETQTLSLKCGFDNIFKLWTKGHRYNTRKARKEGVLVRLAYNLHDWNKYYSVYEDSLRKWGNKASSKYGSELFTKMFRCNSSDIKLWLATYQENVVAGALCFYAKNHVVYWHGAALEESLHLYPVNLMLNEAIKDACEQGYYWFDFNPSGGHEGVKSFKKGFGCSTLQSNLYFHDSNIKKMIYLIADLMH